MPKSKLMLIIGGIAILLIVLFGLLSCNNPKKSDLGSYVDSLKSKILTVPAKQDMSDIPVPQPAVYQTGKARSPFLEPSSVAESAPVNATDAPINAFPLGSLRFVGTIQQGSSMTAIILTPAGKATLVKVGDIIGNQYGKINKIYRDRLEVIEQVNDANPSSQRLITLPLKGKD